MELACAQLLLSVSDIDKSREFYIGKLQMPVVEDHPKMFAFRAGDVRFSVFGGGKRHTSEEASAAHLKVMFRTEDLDATVARLKERGVVFAGEIEEAPGFMRHIELVDPDNNFIFLAQYVRDPLKPAPKKA